MKFTKTLAGFALASSLALPAMAQDPTFFRIGTGGAGGTYFPIGGTIANGISSPPGSRACDEGGQCGVHICRCFLRLVDEDWSADPIQPRR